MGRNPFKEACTTYLENYSINLSKGSLAVVRRRLKIMDRMIKDLSEKGQITTTVPKKFTVDDIYCIYRELVETPGSNGKQREKVTVQKYMNDLNNLCRSHGNFNVEVMYRRFPMAKKSHHKRLPVLNLDQIKEIARKGMEVSDTDRRRIRAYGVVGQGLWKCSTPGLPTCSSQARLPPTSIWITSRVRTLMGKKGQKH